MRDSGRGRRRRVVTPPDHGARRAAARRQALDPPASPGRREPGRAHRVGPRERLPGGRGHRAGGVRQVDPAGRVGAGGGSSGRLGVARPVRRRPGALLALLASAYARVSPGNTDLVADMGGLGVSVLGRAAPRLALGAPDESRSPSCSCSTTSTSCSSPACHDVLSVVVSGIPAGSQVSAASRSEQPHLPRLRAPARPWSCWRVTWPWTRPAPSRSSRKRHVRLTPELAAAVTERTEGWAVGLYLAALIARDADGKAVSDLRRRPVRGRLPLPRVTDAAARRHSAVPAPHRGARAAVRTPVRRRPRWVGRAGASCDGSRRPASSWSRSTAGEAGTATTRCSVSSCSGSSVGSSPTSSPSCTCGRPTGTRRTALPRGARAPAAHGRAGSLRAAGDGAGPPDLPGRSDVDGAALVRGAGRPGGRGLPTARRAGLLDGRADRADRPGAAMGGGRRRRLVRRGAARRRRRRSTRRGPCCGRSCARPDPSRRSPTPASRSTRSQPGARGATRRS